MPDSKSKLTAKSLWVVALVIALGVIRCHSASASASVTLLEPPKGLVAMQDGFIALAEHARPSVVMIITERKREQAPPGQAPMPDQMEPRRSLGSGVLIDSRGYILTSARVVRDADWVKVTLADGKEMSANIISSDAQTDLAIIKIETAKTLVVAPLGNSEEEKVGAWVMSIGCPLGLKQTVTVGVISAQHRSFPNPDLPGHPFREMIQYTDAAINPGNSGAPLINIRGEVIGVSEFVGDNPGSSVGLALGLGFAIPVNQNTKRVIEVLKEGRVPTRGQLGVFIHTVDEALAKVYRVQHGAFVNQVMPGGPADNAGIKADDIVVQFGNTKIESDEDLVRMAEQTEPGTKVPVTVVRGGARQTLTVVIGRMPAGMK